MYKYSLFSHEKTMILTCFGLFFLKERNTCKLVFKYFVIQYVVIHNYISFASEKVKKLLK